MVVTVDLPETMVRMLEAEADRRGVPFDEVVLDGVASLRLPLPEFPVAVDPREEVLLLVRGGMSDRLVAERTGFLRKRVAKYRRQGGLPPNRD